MNIYVVVKLDMTKTYDSVKKIWLLWDSDRYGVETDL